MTLEKASKTGTRLLPLTPGVCRTFHLQPRATEKLGRTCCPRGHMPAEYLMCAAHGEMEKSKDLPLQLFPQAHGGAGKVCAQAFQAVTPC